MLISHPEAMLKCTRSEHLGNDGSRVPRGEGGVG